MSAKAKKKDCSECDNEHSKSIVQSDKVTSIDKRRQKLQIEQLQNKIAEGLNDKEVAEKAAKIISKWLNKKD